ncbi:MAG TPA: HD domain-containing protein [Candidatus Dormibacteraeota bacterium]|nr:HD domain-containing protein [Candidatus Dormibacteraeota bacterium]
MSLDPISQYSRVNLASDPVYGYVKITKGGTNGVPGEASEQDLLDSPWLQRLRRIHQLQSAWWVFHTAEHSRFQHSVGAMHLAGEWGSHLYPSLCGIHKGVPSRPIVEETLRIAGLLHDTGHGPFGHFFDENYLDTWCLDHEAISRHLVLGDLAHLIEGLGASPSGDFGSGERIDPRWVAYLISSRDLAGFEPPTWLEALRPVMLGPFSADNMDYVPRDSFICGVATGPVDVKRIVHYSFISEHGLTQHTHGAEAVFMFLSARLYLYHQVYYHRTVRRIDLQLREIFRATIDRILGGNPLQRMSRFQRLTEWSLLSEVDRWSETEATPEARALGLGWADIVARRLKWTLVYSKHVEAPDLGPGLLGMTREAFAAQIRERLGAAGAAIEFEVDVAAQESRAGDPLGDGSEIVFFDPLTGTYQRSLVLDLFRRLPARIAVFRIFAKGAGHSSALSMAAEEVLDGLMGMPG